MFKLFLTTTLSLGGIVIAEATESGSWKSPISAKLLTEGVVRLTEFLVEDGEIYWLESRPEEGGRAVFVRGSDQQELFNSSFYARSTVHEYGGRAGAVYNGVLYFTNFKDQFLYKAEVGKETVIVANVPNMRYVDLSVHPSGKWLYAVGEDHTNHPNIENFLVKVDLETGEVKKIVTGHDFFGGPRISPDGNQLTYYCWDFVNMPWDGTELWLVNLDENGLPTDPQFITGGVDESVLEPSWSPDGLLYYASDRNGYWNIYDQFGKCLADTPSEFASPPWWSGHIGYSFVTIDDRNYIVSAMTTNGVDSIGLIDRDRRTLTQIDVGFSVIGDVVGYKEGFLFLGSSPTKPSQLAYYNLKTQECTPIKISKELTVPLSYISIPENLEFPTTNGKTAFGFYYAPKNPNYTTAEKPPLIVFVHGGPTSRSSNQLNLGVQYWTSRGFAVMDVNYGGSTGFGREYRNRLRYQWGEVDVDDCCNAALYLCDQGLADPNRMAIRGGSAGGYTTLAALAHRNVFQAGGNYFGVTDIFAMLKDSHKFESRYFDLLVGPPEQPEKYEQYSPVFHANQITAPVIIFQGDEDKVVPPEQSDVIYEALLKNKIPTAYLLFEGEQHGFRKAPNIIRSLEAEYYFYCKIFGLNLPKDISPVKIENLD